MTDWTTIRVTQAAKDKAEDRKPVEMTWTEYLASEQYEPELTVDVQATVDAAEIAKLTADEVEQRLR